MVAEHMQKGRGEIPIQPLEMGGLAFSFFLIADSGLPMRFSSVLANLAFARFCAGVWACGVVLIRNFDVSFAKENNPGEGG